MTVSASLSVSPSAPAAPGAVVTAVYAVSGNSAGASQVLAIEGATATLGGSTVYRGRQQVAYAPGRPGAGSHLRWSRCAPASTFTALPSNPAAFTATVPAAAGAGVWAQVTVSGSVTVGGGPPMAVSASITLPSSVPVTPPPSGTVPYPAALATGHALLEQYLPADLYAWRYQPGTTTPVVNGSGVSENPDSPRNVSVIADGGLSVLQLGVTSTEDCGVIQSPGTYPTASGVVEALVKFSGFTSGGSEVFADWASFWLYGANWPAGGEIDAVETSYGNSYISYHYGSGSSSTASTNPWTYAGKTVQLSPKNTTSAPAAPNILPDAWAYVTLAFGKAASGNYCDVYYNGTLYCTIAGAFVTGDPMFITAGTSFGGPVLGSSQVPFDQPGNIELQYVRVFS